MEKKVIPKRLRTLLRLRGGPSFLVFLVFVVSFYPLTNSLIFQPYRVGFKIVYPEEMRVVESRIWKLAPIKEWGIIQGVSKNFLIEINWAPIIDNITIDTNLNVPKFYSNYSKEIEHIGNSSVFGHKIEIKMDKNIRTTVFENQTYHIAYAEWICIESNRVFLFQFGSTSDDVVSFFENILEEFKCHIKTPTFS